MIKEFFNTTVCAEVLAFIASLVFLKGNQPLLWRLFPFFLLLVLCVEAAGTYFQWHNMNDWNHYTYNFFMPLQAAFYFLLFYKFMTPGMLRKAVAAAAVAFAAAYILETALSPFQQYRMQSRIFLSCIVVVLSCIFYFTLIRADGITNPLRHPPFWIVTGLFFFYFGSLPMFAMYQKVSELRVAGNLSFYDLVMGCLCIIFYGSWITGFIWAKKQGR